jgi:hypothetical protein
MSMPFATGCRDRSEYGPGNLLPQEIGDDDVRALSCERRGNGTPMPRAPPVTIATRSRNLLIWPASAS